MLLMFARSEITKYKIEPRTATETYLLRVKSISF
jgi:hypothetical protein